MRQKIRSFAIWLCILFAATAASENLRAETHIQVIPDDQLLLFLDGIDDHIICYLNDAEVARRDFGGPSVNVDLVPKMKSGENRLNCKVTDDNAGSSFSFGYSLEQKRGKGSWLIFRSGASCSGDADCTRTNPVLDETIWINYFSFGK